MPLSLREKQSFYQSLAQLIRSGIPFPAALEKLTSTSRGPRLKLIRTLRAQLANGLTVGEAFAAEPGVTTLEVAVLGAVEKSGQLPDGMRELASYFGALEQARAAIIRRCAYPVFLLHFGIFVLNVPTLVLKDARTFWMETGQVFGVIYGAVVVLLVLVPPLREAGARSVLIDQLLGAIPLIGRIRRSFALSRFSTVYGLQLDSGVNVIDAVISAGEASRSGRIRAAIDRLVPEVRTGGQVGPLLGGSGAFPEDFVQTMIVGEETGGLDEVLKRSAEEFRVRALTALDLLADWLPKLIYVAIVIYLAWRTVDMANTGIAEPLRKVMEM